MKKTLAALLAACCMLCSGCTFSAAVDLLITPPKLSVEQEQIYKALQSAEGTNIRLKYPKSGDYLSAFIVGDMDSDGADEALVFYEKTTMSKEENQLRVTVLDQIDGAWRSVYSRPAAGAEVEQVTLSPLGENARINIIVGYSLVNQGERIVEVYDYRNGALECTLSKDYSVFQVTDLDDNNQKELLLVCGQAASRTANAALYLLSANGTYYESHVPLNESFTDCAKLLYGKAVDGTTCIYIDGLTGTASIQTQILTVRDGVLAVVYADQPESPVKTVRAAGYLTRDMDHDGIAELPLPTLFPGYTIATESEQIPMTSWYTYRYGMLARKYSGYYSITDGYAFLMPARWERKVTVKLDSVAEEVVFYQFHNTLAESTTELLRICATADSVTAADRLDNGYLLLGQKGGKQYLAQISDAENDLCPTAGEVLYGFQYG